MTVHTRAWVPAAHPAPGPSAGSLPNPLQRSERKGSQEVRAASTPRFGGTNCGQRLETPVSGQQSTVASRLQSREGMGTSLYSVPISILSRLTNLLGEGIICVSLTGT